ncbi:MAG: hypothetical protein M0026_18520 [Nocardiopsaceae bacterium]|nr:hypothetical protein [Nocardiopsaceae bacterium]
MGSKGTWRLERTHAEPALFSRYIRWADPTGTVSGLFSAPAVPGIRGRMRRRHTSRAPGTAPETGAKVSA